MKSLVSLMRGVLQLIVEKPKTRDKKWSFKSWSVLESRPVILNKGRICVFEIRGDRIESLFRCEW